MSKTRKNTHAETVEQREAQQGERMIEIKVRFWTNGIADGKGIIQPKHAWSSGAVRIERNESHGIVPQKSLPFHSLMDLTSVIEKVLVAHNITLHSSRKMRKYFEPKE
jgi:hypothetical protein